MTNSSATYGDDRPVSGPEPTDPWAGVVDFLADLRERRRLAPARRGAGMLSGHTLADIGLCRVGVQFGAMVAA
ncbi:MAG: hypothetical protein EXQ87_07600 [Alphaproteobacteria bacterium]|nr:hypothetical protein [Alphaproteobacteria bacterium]